MNLLIFERSSFLPLVVFKRSQQTKVELHGREMADEFCLKIPEFHVTFRDILHAVNLRHGTDGFTYPPKEGVQSIFFSVGTEPANLGTKEQHATFRPPKPLSSWLVNAVLFSMSCLRYDYCLIVEKNHTHAQQRIQKVCDNLQVSFHLPLPMLVGWSSVRDLLRDSNGQNSS